MPFYVYILRCRDGSYYTGHTDNLEVRVWQHERGEVPGYTSHRRPVRLLYADVFQTRDEAFAAERQIKGWRRAKKEALVARDWDTFKVLARTAGSVSPAHGSTGSP